MIKNTKSLQENIYNHRKILHNIAEVGRKEFKTAKYIRDYLDSINVKCDTYLTTATIGILKGKIGKKTIAFRADIDGLVTEEGVKHLCGHDGHTSILLGLVEFINNNLDILNDNIVFIFQPAEEGPGGAEDLIKEGIIDKYKIDEIYGLHIYPEVKEGYIGLAPGYFMAQAGDFNIDIISKSGHGAMPQNGIDGILIASNLVNILQSIVSRNVSPLDNAVLTVGKINGGTRRNIIAENVRLEGTLRTFDPKVYDSMKTRMKEICQGVEKSYNCKINLNIKDDYPSVNNNKHLYEEFVDALGEEKVIKLAPMMISEDFSYYQREVPGLFFMLGSRDEEKGFVNGLHNLNFNFNEGVLLNGLDSYIQLLKYKNSLE
nr:amidohydrolase [[Clostridium] dakarense]